MSLFVSVLSLGICVSLSVFMSLSLCVYCHKGFTVFGNVNFRKVRDHDHVTGLYRGAAHSICNLRVRKQFKIPVFIHNFRGYDAHIIVNGMSKLLELQRKIKPIGQGLERYLQLTWGDHIVFRDSYQFLQGSLDVLVSNLANETGGISNFKNLRSHFPTVSEELLLKKAMFPYDWFDSFEKLNKDCLPTKEEFFNVLSQSPCSEENYQRAQKAWEGFNCNSFKDYMLAYLNLDILQLADIFEAFRNFVMIYYGIDPAHYCSSPAVSWDAMLKMTGVKIELITDQEMFRMINGGMRGGLVSVVKRHAKANNPEMGTEYNPNEPTSHLLYADSNNLYGSAMMQALPLSCFRWSEPNEIDWLFKMFSTGNVNLPPNTGFILEVDLTYPTHLHAKHSDLPLAFEKARVSVYEKSVFQQLLADVYHLKPTQWKKLIATCDDKFFYTIHHKNLQFYIKHGIILTKIHRAIAFYETNWMKPYVEINTQMRQKAQSNFERDMFKLFVNSVYGKTCENLTKRTDIVITTSKEQHIKLTTKPQCIGQKIFTDKMAVVNLRKPRTIINKPFFVGYTVLELSKLLMLQYHYEHFLPYYGPACRKVYGDTDSFVYHVQTKDVNKDCYEFRGEVFDMSTFPSDHPYYNADYKDVPGKLKIETKGKCMTEFVGLSPKVYSYTTIDPKTQEKAESRRAKGFQRSVRDKSMAHSDFLFQLYNPGKYPGETNGLVTTRRIGSEKHVIYQYVVCF